jgi:hypothetical protein
VEAVRIFVGNVAPADDLTLLVVRRSTVAHGSSAGL